MAAEGAQDPFREEIRVSSVGDDVPAELSDLLLGVTRRQPLRYAATVSTDRRVTKLLAADGRLLAEIDDDNVQARVAGEAAALSAWREVEVELGEGDLDVLHALGAALRRAGAWPSSSPSKLGRALILSPGDEPAVDVAPDAAEVVRAYIVEQQRVILAGDLTLRRDNDSAIHKTRVATRRLRSTLRVFGSLFDEASAASLDNELRWYAALLGEVRDRQVLRSRLDDLALTVDEALVLGPVVARIDNELAHDKAEHWRLLQHDMAGERYLGLLDDVARWAEQPPWTPEAHDSPKLVKKKVNRAERKVAKRLRKANASGDIEKLHGVRKAAKRARYAAEAAEPVLGKKASGKQARRYQKLQDLLGEHQDSLLSADLLRGLGAKTLVIGGENGCRFRVLLEREAPDGRRTGQKAQADSQEVAAEPIRRSAVRAPGRLRMRQRRPSSSRRTTIARVPGGDQRRTTIACAPGPSSRRLPDSPGSRRRPAGRPRSGRPRGAAVRARRPRGSARGRPSRGCAGCRRGRSLRATAWRAPSRYGTAAALITAATPLARSSLNR